MEKGENAGNQQFLLFPQCFLPFSKQISVFESHLFYLLQMLSIWTGPKFCSLVKTYRPNPSLHHDHFFTTLRNKPLENIVRKGENAGSLFPCFQHHQTTHKQLVGRTGV